MKGHGLGSIFAGLFRRAMPLMKEGGKYLAKQAIRAGTSTLHDILEGDAPKYALKRRVSEAKAKIMKDAKRKAREVVARKMRGGGRKRNKKKNVKNKRKNKRGKKVNKTKKRTSGKQKPNHKDAPKSKKRKTDLF